MSSINFPSTRLALSALGFGLLVWMIWLLAENSSEGLQGSPANTESVSKETELQLAEPLSVGSPRIADDTEQPSSALPSSEPNSGPTVDFLVVSKGLGEPLENATLQELRDPAQSITLGSTDEQGKLQVILRDQTIHSVVVTKSGYAEERVLLLIEQDEATIELALQRAVSLEGQVLLPDGSPSDAGVRVVAWLANLPMPTRSDFEDWLAGEKTWLIGAETRADGRYSIPDAADAGIYRLVAGSVGYTTGLAVVRAGGNPAKIQLLPLVGVQLKIVEPDGSPPQLTFPYYGIVVAMTGRIPLEGLSGKEGRLALSDLPEIQTAGPAAFDRLLLFYALTQLDRTPGVKAETHFPGYMPMSADVDLSPIADQIPVRILQLEELPINGRGTVQVKFMGYEVPKSSGRNLPAGTIEFVAEDRTWGARYSITSMEESFQIEGLPYGNYTYRFDPSFQLNASAQLAGTITVNSDVVELPIDLSGLGAIEFKVLAGDQRLTTLYLQFPVSLANGSPGETILPCFGGVLRVDLVPPGEYMIGEELIASPSVTLAFEERLTVLPGAVSEKVVRVTAKD